MKKIKSMLVFSNGNVAVFDKAGKQIPELQHNLILEWAKAAERLGYQVEGLGVEAEMLVMRIIKAPSGEFYLEERSEALP